MQRIRKLVVLVILICGMLSFSACNHIGLGAGHRKFGAVFMSMSNPLYETLNASIESIIKENGDQLITLDPAYDNQRQIQQVEYLIRERVDAIFLTPVDWQGIKPALAACAEAGIPVINIDAPVYDTDLVACIVAPDNYHAGKLCAQDLMKQMSSGTVVVLEKPSASISNERVTGFVDTLAEDGRYRIARYTVTGTPQSGMTVTDSLLEEQVIFEAVMTFNEPSATGVAAALKAAGKTGDILLYSVGGSPDTKRMISDGIFTATVLQSPKGTGKAAAEAAYMILNGGYWEDVIRIPVSLVTKDNIRQIGTDNWE